MFSRNEFIGALVVLIIDALLVTPVCYLFIRSSEDYDEFKMYVIRQLEEADSERKKMSSRIDAEKAKVDANAATVQILTDLLLNKEDRQE